MKQTQQYIKEFIDKIAAFAILLITSPVILIAMLLIKFSSPGPIFFTQERIGRDLQPFRVIKLRTMHAESRSCSLGSTTILDDPRVFSVGNWMRKLKIDELPQVINVIQGTMSLVGPRPTVKEDYEQMNQEQKRRAEVKPGITGLAQIKGNTSLSWPERIRLDLKYIDQQSIWLDMKILIQTLIMCLSLGAETHPSGENEW